MRRVIGTLGAGLPHGWRDFWAQFLVFWTFYVGYELSAHLANGERTLALENGTRVIEVEKALGIYVERSVQQWTLNRAPAFFEWLANNTYFTCQFLISFGFMLFLYFRRNHAFYFVRNTVLFADLIALIGYFTLPTAPPRAFAGFVDTLHSQPINMQSSVVTLFGNPYAAMPSLHSAYALTLGVAAVCVFRSRVARTVAALYPLLVIYAIVATGNHFLLDAVAGACVAGLAAMLSLAVARGVLPRAGRAPRGFLVPRPQPLGAD